jgi:phosphosulfolactate phosphohydrolase-like enzyme
MDSAAAAARLAASYPDSFAALGASRSARNLRRHGLEDDIEWCARENALDIVPRFIRTLGPAAEVSL